MLYQRIALREREAEPGAGPDWLSGALGLKDEARQSGGNERGGPTAMMMVVVML